MNELSPQEAWALYSCYGCDDAAVDKLLTRMWVEAGKPPRKASDVPAWEAVHGDSIATPDPRDALAAHIVTHGVSGARLYDAMTRAFNQMVEVELYVEWVIRTTRK